MDPDAFSSSLFKWEPRAAMPPPSRLLEAAAAAAHPPPQLHAAAAQPSAASYSVRPRPELGLGLGGLEELFQAYGIRYYTAAKIAELGFTVNTLLDMKEDEIDDMMTSLSHIFRWDLLVGERYGIKAAVRAERRRLEEEELRRRHLLSGDGTNALDALSQEGLSEEGVQQHEKEAVGSGGGGAWEVVAAAGKGKQRRRKSLGKAARTGGGSMEEEYETEGQEEDEEGDGGGGISERQREHPFIVTEPGEVARGKKNGLDYLFHLYEQCREFLIQVQNIAKERGEKCPTKVTNQVFRYAKKAGASYINKPKMRHYVHCYALHCLDEEASNALRRAFKERGENVGAWRQACYKPLVAIAALQAWDIDAIFNAHPRLSIWYVPTKLRQLCHAERSKASAPTSSSVSVSIPATACSHLPLF
ncbi:floricaula/leafy homolog 2 isoform X2 [Ipomoea triloba]|uniref:floricaula/leafy homolog 2 isoform X2 n=1 Tax=Ipomoea triloba TaxID=35885 RepID=UPI00125E1D8E|nr:floricaula/leafy homolog 2 isoform X2 [Ipomoea triloba]